MWEVYASLLANCTRLSDVHAVRRDESAPMVVTLALQWDAIAEGWKIVDSTWKWNGTILSLRPLGRDVYSWQSFFYSGAP
jgi:hypothetical protein